MIKWSADPGPHTDNPGAAPQKLYAPPRIRPGVLCFVKNAPTTETRQRQMERPFYTLASPSLWPLSFFQTTGITFLRSTGHLVAVQRTDLRLEDAKARGLAIADHRTADLRVFLQDAHHFFLL